MGGLSYGAARPAVTQLDLAAVAKYMFWLMYRNVASDGLVFDDPVNAGVISPPGAVLASPSWENSATHVTQDYVYHWTRDAAVVALELAWGYANGTLPDNQPLRRPWLGTRGQAALPAGAVASGALALSAGRVDGLTNSLPRASATTA